MVNIEKALTINGWLNADEATWLAEQAHRSKMIAEIGSWMGRSTRAICDNTDGLVFAVDTWKGTIDDPNFPPEPSENYFYDQFTNNLGDHLWTGKLTAMKMTSLEAAAKFAGHVKFDFIFVDAAHDYVSVRNDILAWKPLLADGGMLSGHDYDLAYPGVVQAVRELVAPVPKQAANGSSIWYCEF